ncbi:MAG: hypothetical protein IRY99_20095, partial [Isosphaeraceae bacterium]|nr:hypothetical protein [Isosphaeraceae bacterium]
MSDAIPHVHAEAPAGTGAAGRDRLDRLTEEFDQRAEEFAERCRRGEAPSISEFEHRYPECAEKIRALLPSVAMMEQLKHQMRPVWERKSSGGSTPERLGEFRVLRELGRG